MIATANKMHYLERVAISQRCPLQRRARDDFTIALNRDFFRSELELAHEVGNCRSSGAAGFAVQGDRFHALSDSRLMGLRNREFDSQG